MYVQLESPFNNNILSYFQSSIIFICTCYIDIYLEINYESSKENSWIFFSIYTFESYGTSKKLIARSIDWSKQNKREFWYFFHSTHILKCAQETFDFACFSLEGWHKRKLKKEKKKEKRNTISLRASLL